MLVVVGGEACRLNPPRDWQRATGAATGRRRWPAAGHQHAQAALTPGLSTEPSMPNPLHSFTTTCTTGAWPTAEPQARPGSGDRTKVMKFDGSSFATRERFGPVCQWLRRRLDE